jgi:hypothetical protein
LLAYLAAAGIPQVDAIPQSDSEDIMRRPIHEVEVEVVLQCGRIQHLEATEGKFRQIFGTQLFKSYSLEQPKRKDRIFRAQRIARWHPPRETTKSEEG